jgi:hypothetical protein
MCDAVSKNGACTQNNEINQCFEAHSTEEIRIIHT